MNNNKEMFISKTIQKMYNNENIKFIIDNILIDICAEYEINNVYAAMKNNFECKYICVFDYTLNQEQKTDVNTINLTVHNNLKNNKIFDDYENEFVEAISKKQFFQGEELKNISELLKKMGYNISENTQEILIHFIKIENYFSYIIFAKYSNSTKFSENEIIDINNICNVIRTNIEKKELEQLLYHESKIKNDIIKNENMPVCMIEENTYKVIYHNEIYKQIFPNIKNNEVYAELLEQKNKNIGFSIDKTRIEKDIYANDKYWIKKSIPFDFKNGMKANLIYARDTSDYIQQLEVIDLLTSALSLKGLKKYYDQVIKNSDYSYVLCTLDIDKFKYINNNFGFDIGDEILKGTARVMGEFIKDDEMFCRINEDKFAIILNYNEFAIINDRFNILKDLLENMKESESIDKALRFIGGITAVDKEQPLNILIDHANSARKSVKGSHKSTFAFYDIKVQNQMEREMVIEKRMNIAVDNEEFVPFLQPKFNLDTKTICGAEALVRWLTPNGMIYPNEFIPLFEKNGFIRTLDFIIYEKTMEFIRECLDKNLKVYPISLNVSRNHIQDKEFIGKILKLIEKYKIPLELIELEVTEGVFVEDKEILKNFIDNIKAENITVSIDDFGTAYSSLHVLKDINVDIIKIDKGFLDNMKDNKNNQNNKAINDKSRKDQIVIKNIINMAKELDFKVICEGVETDEQIKLLKSIGCQLGQGYVFAKPMSILEYEEQFLMV